MKKINSFLRLMLITLIFFTSCGESSNSSSSVDYNESIDSSISEEIEESIEEDNSQENDQSTERPEEPRTIIKQCLNCRGRGTVEDQCGYCDYNNDCAHERNGGVVKVQNSYPTHISDGTLFGRDVFESSCKICSRCNGRGYRTSNCSACRGKGTVEERMY